MTRLSYFIAVCCLVLMPSMHLLAQYTTGGSTTTFGTNCYQLTPASNSQAGYVYQNAPLNLNEPFNYKFTVYLGTNNAGADGIVFVLKASLSSPYIGSGGGGIGFLNLGTNTMGVEVDTWYNGNYNDITADHIAILKAGSVNHTGANSLAGPIQASASSINVEDGQYHDLNIRWDPVSKEFDVYLDCDYRLQYQGDLIDSIFGGDSLVHWGFVGSTGGANNIQRFCFTQVIDSLVTDLSDATICLGDTVQLEAGESAVSYSWSPATGLSSTASSSPFASPTTTTTYVVEQTYACDTLFDTATVTIIQPTFNTLVDVEDALCHESCDGEIDLEVVNGSGIFSYNWSTGDTTEDVTGLCAGSYTVTIQDMDTASSTYLCTLIETYDVDDPIELVAGIVNETTTTCPGGATCDASATATVNGGTFPYSYLWSSGEFTPIANALCADSNFVTITDANGCTSSAFVVIDVPDSIKTFAGGDTMICISNVTPIVAASTGGTNPFSYIWYENSLTGIVVATTDVANVSPEVTTTYFVQSIDANGCPGDTSQVTVRVRPPLHAETEGKDTICPYDTIPLSVEGFGGDSVYTFTWSSGAFGSVTDVSPNQPQWFFVTVTDVCGTPSYKDSIFVQVGGYSPIDVTIRVEEDSICPGDVVYLIADGRGGWRGPKEYEFRWDHDPTEKSNFLFVQPEKTTTYTAEISDLCLSEPGTASATIYVGTTDPPQFEVNPGVTCAASDILMSITDFDSKYRYTWDFGDGTVYYDIDLDSLFYTYNEPGCYDLSIAVTTDFGCTSERTERCAVKILEQPMADFGTVPSHPSNVDPIIMFVDQSVAADSIYWYIQGDTLINDQSFQREFYETSVEWPVMQVVVNGNGCRDTIVRSVVWKNVTTLYYPSAFSPNGDNLNDEWGIYGEAIEVTDFVLKIYDRWGQQVFGANTINRKWDGTLPGGERAPQGVYPFVLEYRDHTGEGYMIKDNVVISSGGRPQGLR